MTENDMQNRQDFEGHQQSRRDEGSSASGSSNSSTREEVTKLESRIDEMQKFQAEMLNMLKQMTLGSENNQSASKTQNGEDRVKSGVGGGVGTQATNRDINQTTQEPTMTQLMYLMHADQRQARFM